MFRIMMVLGIALLLITESLATEQTTASATSKVKITWVKKSIGNSSNSLNVSWGSMPNAPVNVDATDGVYVGDIYYNVLGQPEPSTPQDPAYDKMQIWNGTSWSVSSTSHPGGGIKGICAAEWNGKIVISGGDNNSWSDIYYWYTTIYDPITGDWIVSTIMPVAMRKSEMACVNGKCYIFGGDINGSLTNCVYCWTPGDSAMVQKASIPILVQSPRAVTYGDYVYLFGGRIALYSDVPTSDIWRYDTTSDSWTLMPTSLLHARFNHGAVRLGDKVIIFGGAAYGIGMNYVEVYDLTTEFIEASTPLPYATANFGSAGKVNIESKTTQTGTIIICRSGGDGSEIHGTVEGISMISIQPSSLGMIKSYYH